MERWGGCPRGGHPFARPRARTPVLQQEKVDGRCDPRPRPDQRDRARLRPREPRSGPRSRWRSSSSARRGTSCRTPSAAPGDRQRARGSRCGSRTPTARCSACLRNATAGRCRAAVDAAKAAAPAWRDLSFDDRAAILLKAADLLAGPWRARINAATMLGQSKTAYQAEIDAACELIDFWRFNVHFARQILEEQPPLNSKGSGTAATTAPLEGFVYAVTPFNFTAIAGNLPTAPALMGNTVVWKPSHTQQLAAQLTMELLEEAGMPPGVINLVTGDGRDVSEVGAAPTPTSRASTSPARPRSSRTCGGRSARTSRRYRTTRASSARPAARTSSSPTRAPTPTCCAPR